MKKLRVIKAIIITLIAVIVRLPKIYYYKKTKNSEKLNRLRVNTFINIYKGLTGINLKITNKNSSLDTSTPYIICSNHSSYLDIGCMLVTSYNLGLKDAFFITKKELGDNFLFKHYILNLDVLIDRNNKLDTLKGFKKASSKLMDGKSLLIFPEGTISKTYPPNIQDFKPGAFSLATKLGIPILPITIVDAWKIMHNTGSEHGIGKGTINIVVHKPIITKGLNNDEISNLNDRVYKIISSEYSESN